MAVLRFPVRLGSAAGSGSGLVSMAACGAGDAACGAGTAACWTEVAGGVVTGDDPAAVAADDTSLGWAAGAGVGAVRVTTARGACVGSGAAPVVVDGAGWDGAA